MKINGLNCLNCFFIGFENILLELMVFWRNFNVFFENLWFSLRFLVYPCIFLSCCFNTWWHAAPRTRHVQRSKSIRHHVQRSRSIRHQAQRSRSIRHLNRVWIVSQLCLNCVSTVSQLCLNCLTCVSTAPELCPNCVPIVCELHVSQLCRNCVWTLSHLRLNCVSTVSELCLKYALGCVWTVPQLLLNSVWTVPPERCRNCV